MGKITDDDSSNGKVLHSYWLPCKLVGIVARRLALGKILLNLSSDDK
jgi:hypothetical protein